MRRTLLSLSLIAAWSLTGCVAAGVAGAGAVGTAVVQEKSVGTALDDATASSEIKGKLMRESRARFGEVDVEVANGLVLLSGRVTDPEDRILAERTAWSSSRVDDVANEIKVEGPGGIMANVSDAVISARVRSSLVGSKTVRSVNFNVETYNGVVYLMGIARSQKELKHAAEKASYIGGVKEVVSYVRLADNRTVEAATVTRAYPREVLQTQAALPKRPVPLKSSQPQPIGSPTYGASSQTVTGEELAGGGIY